jgi:hypothetical protein
MTLLNQLLMSEGIIPVWSVEVNAIGDEDSYVARLVNEYHMN